MTVTDSILNNFLQWAEREPSIRARLLVGLRARQDGANGLFDLDSD